MHSHARLCMAMRCCFARLCTDSLAWSVPCFVDQAWLGRLALRYALRNSDRKPPARRTAARAPRECAGRAVTLAACIPLGSQHARCVVRGCVCVSTSLLRWYAKDARGHAKRQPWAVQVVVAVLGALQLVVWCAVAQIQLPIPSTPQVRLIGSFKGICPLSRARRLVQGLPAEGAPAGPLYINLHSGFLLQWVCAS